MLPLILGAWLAIAPSVSIEPMAVLRRQSIVTPVLAIARGRELLDHGDLLPETQRETLRWMGRAALLASNDATLAEVTLRLDELARRGDDVASAYAGFLRAERQFERADDALAMKTALAAAERLQDRREPQLRALVAYQLCDALASSEQYDRAHTYCDEAAETYTALRDEYELARTENVRSYIYYNQKNLAEAVALSERARARFIALDEGEIAEIVGDNLARIYIEIGRASQALALSRASLAAERRNGRLGHAVLSCANIARALSALGRHAEALAEMAGAIDAARTLKLDAHLPDLYDTQSRLAEAAGDLKLALAAARTTQDMQERMLSADAKHDIAELEARYDAREKDLRIGELERGNRLQQLKLEAAASREVARAAAGSRERWALAVSVLLALLLGVAVLLLVLLLRVQRRYTKHLHLLAHTDPLTGAGNRRAFFAKLNAALVTDSPVPRVVMLIDIDHFKRINDGFGHPFGDAVLRQTAQTLEATLEHRGFLARFGGEEFGILCSDLAPTEALRLADRLRRAVADLRVEGASGPVEISVSIGLAMFDPERFHDSEAWLRHADRALYAAKSRGRNRVVASTAV